MITQKGVFLLACKESELPTQFPSLENYSFTFLLLR